ncbi:MAG: hypothetical protein PHI49_03175 [Halothiobacillaceae bacterium]|nr:hypothetical protein [Halothiobacillaceae bacterium]
MFDIHRYKFDETHNALDVAGEAMVFHCHHYMNYLQRSILDADYIDSRPFLIGAAADAAWYQLKNLCAGLDRDAARRMAESAYKAFGYGLIDLSTMTEDGGEFSTVKSFFSRTWPMKFGPSTHPVDFYTTGYLAAAYAVLFDVPLSEIQAEQTHCMACGERANVHLIRRGAGNFATYPAKAPTRFKDVPKHALNWAHESAVTEAFLGAHAHFVGNEEGYIPAFGVYLVRVHSDYVNRLQFEFMRAMGEVAGEYGETLGRELLLEAGHACGFFTYGGIMTSNEWAQAVKPYLHSREDWIRGLLSLINTMGWGYHTIIELSPDRAVFRNYNDFEDLSHARLYGPSRHPIHWANSGGFTGLMQLIYNTDLVEGQRIDTEEGFRQMRRAKRGYKTRMTRGITCGDDYLEVEVYR